MKKLLTILFFFICLHASARNFYFSTIAGNDARTSTQAQSPATPWQTLSKLNSFFSSLLPGDSVLFNRGETFYGYIIVNKSGTIGLPIVIGAYGTGAKPVITALVTLSGWVQSPTNVWTSAVNSSLGAEVNIVLVNGIIQQIGRYPNAGTANEGYLNYENHTSNTGITDNELTTSTNWTGAQAVVRINHYNTNRRTITTHAATNLTFAVPFASTPQNGMGYYFENDIRTLDVTGEWYYNPSTKKVSIYSTTAPTNIQAGSLTYGVKSLGFNYITFDHLSLTGADTSFAIGKPSSAGPGAGGNNIVIQYCTVINSGKIGVFFGEHADFTMQYDSIMNSLNDGVKTVHGGSFNMLSNYIHNSGYIAGMAQDVGGIGAYIIGGSGLVKYNRVIRSGWHGIYFEGDNCIIEKNFVDSVCFVKNDGGGIYTQGATIRNGQKILNNIVSNAIGAMAGSNAPTLRQAELIYIDAHASNTLVDGNSMSNGDKGIYLHGGRNNTLLNNTTYNCNYGLYVSEYDTGLIRNTIIKNNLFFAKTATQRTRYFHSVNNDVALMASSMDSNYDCRPVREPSGINNAGSITTGSVIQVEGGYYSIDKFPVPFPSYDLHSRKTAKGYDTLRYETNQTAASLTIPLNGYTWLDPRGVRYKTQLTIAPYTSIILIRDTIVPVIVNVLPVSNAGTNQVITLPTSTVTLTGTGTDADGVISTYAWTKFSGGAATITTPSAATTTVTGLVAGTYIFRLTVTDNSGGTATSNMQVIVNPAPPVNIAPTANAGSDSTISLPAGITLSGSNSFDVEGPLAAYSWHKLSGPGYTINDSTLSNPALSGLSVGTYIFRLTVTDSAAATGYDDVTITVNPTSLSVTVTVTPISCNGATGIIQIGATGGVAPYTGSTGTYTQAAGTYTFIIIDSVGAHDTAIVTLSQPSALSVTDSIGIITVYAGTTTATIYASGGTAPYEYSIGGGSWTTSNTFTIGAGNYTVTVRDANGCTSSISFSETQPLADPASPVVKKRGKHQYY